MKTQTNWAPPKYDFPTWAEAREWAHRESLIYNTDEECQMEAERLLTTITVEED